MGMIPLLLHRSFFFNVNRWAPLGLFITSASCSTIFGEFSRGDIIQILALVKEIILSARIDRKKMSQFFMNPKLIAPVLYITSTLMSLYNADKNSILYQRLREQVEHVDKSASEIKTQLHEIQKAYAPPPILA